MKQILSKFIRPAIGIAILALVVSIASAWTAPTGSFPTGNVSAPVNTGNVPQSKNASFSVVGQGSNLTASGNVLGSNGIFSTLLNASQGRVGCVLFCNDLTTADIFRAGKYVSGNFDRGISLDANGGVFLQKTPLFINLSTNTGSQGRNGLTLFTSSDNITGGAGAVVQTNADRFSFWNSTGTDQVGISAKRIQLTEGAGPGKVLTSDASGNASWGDTSNSFTPEVAMYVRQGGDLTGSSDYKTAKCSNEYPIIISAGGQCSSPAQIQEMYVTYVGKVNDPGVMAIRCSRADQGSVSAGTVSQARPVCMKAGSGGTSAPSSPGADWYTLLPEGPFNPTTSATQQSCYAWLDSMNSTFTPTASAVAASGSNMRVVGTNAPTGVNAQKNCAFKGTYVDLNQQNQTVCTYKTAHTSAPVTQIQIPGTTTYVTVQLKPTASCVGLDPISGANAEYTTEILW